MPVASNPLLQPASATQTSAANALLSSKPQEAAPTGADSFASVYSRQSQADAAQKADAAQVYADKLASAAANKPSFASQADPAKPAVADSGKDLPAKAKTTVDDKTADSGKADANKADGNKVDSTHGNDKKVDASKDKDATAKTDDAKAAKGEKTDKAEDAAADDAALADAAPRPTDPTLDPTTLLTPAVDPAATAAAATAAATPPAAVDPSVLAMVAPPPVAPVAVDAKASGKSDDDFDPDADPLADLPAVRLALEQNAKAQGTTSAHAADPHQAAAGAQQADDNAAAAGLSTLIQQQATTPGKAGSTEEIGAASLDDSAKGIKGGIGEGGSSAFADRLSALSQATGKPVSSAPATPPASPLAMNQSGWTEGVVNRVMYLSSQNLKSADIQLSPAELGRLDIKVTMGADQQTQVTFVSAHVGVREALENQQTRLKDMFAQQGLGQMDVNVSDQSRQQQQNPQSQAQESARGTGGRLGRGDGIDTDDGVSEAAAVVHSTSVIGSSAVDYYA